MTWRGAMRSLAAASRAAERESNRRHRALLRQQQQLVKQAVLQQASLEAQLYEAQMARLLSVHQECAEAWDWEALAQVEAPQRPEPMNESEQSAQLMLDQYSPGFFDRLFSREAAKRADLEQRLEQAKEEDRKVNLDRQQHFQKEFEEWQTMTDVAKGVLGHDLESYKKALEEANPLSEISDLGSSITLRSGEPWYMEASIAVRGSDVVPTEIKTLTQSGKLSVKKMPQGQFNQTYQDYVCSSAIRVGRELFALLPIDMVFVHALDDLLNTATGYRAKAAILSVALTRLGLAELNFETVDCSDAMQNFVCNMRFSKTNGFSAVDQLDPTQFSSKPS